jgi:hypothetical protein
VERADLAQLGEDRALVAALGDVFLEARERLDARQRVLPVLGRREVDARA